MYGNAGGELDHWSSLVEVRDAIAKGEVTSLEVTESLLARIETTDAQVHAYARVTGELAREQAAEADRRRSDGAALGPLHGVPIAVKDNCWTAGVVTTNGLATNDAFVPPEDSTVVRNLRAAGAVIVGKLAQTEGAFAGHRPDITIPVNPWNEQLWTGESSSGSAVGVSSGLCYASIGTDTGGSIRFPAAQCGLAGIKPTWGRVSRFGVFENSASMDHVGPMARTVADLAVMLTAMAGPDPKDPTAVCLPVPDYLSDASGLAVTGLRIGVDESYNLKNQDAPTVAALRDAVDLLERLGAEIIPVALHGVDQAVEDWLPTSGVEMAAAHRDVPQDLQDTYGEPLRSLIGLGMGQSAVDHFVRHQRRLDFRGVVDEVLTRVDVLLTPVLTGAAITLAQMDQLGKVEGSLEALVRYTAPFDMTGHPALVLPGGSTDAGAPVSIQFVGRNFDEARLFGLGMALQQATDWHTRRANV